MNRIFVGGLLAVTMVHSTGAAQDINTGAHRLLEVAPGIYAVESTFAGAAATLIINDSSVIVIDSHSTPASSAALIDAVGELTDAPIRYVINTHWHIDHHAGNQAYLTNYSTPVDFIAHEHTRVDIPTLGREQYEEMAPYRTMPLDNAAKQLESGQNDDGEPLNDEQLATIRRFHEAQANFIETADEFEFSLPNLTISNDLTLYGDPYTVQVMYLYPAHTRGDLVVYVPDQKVLIIGDILTKPILWSWSSYPRDYIRTLTALEALDFDKLIIGHGGPILEGKEYMITVRQFMETIVAFTTESSAAGLSAERAAELGAADRGIQSFRRRFVASNEQENDMFDQMVGWTIDRAYLEMK